MQAKISLPFLPCEPAIIIFSEFSFSAYIQILLSESYRRSYIGKIRWLKISGIHHPIRLGQHVGRGLGSAGFERYHIRQLEKSAGE
jgi:hypothetical protein